MFNNRLFAAGYIYTSSGVVYSSLDGNNWLTATFVGSGIRALAPFNGRLYAGDQSGRVYISPDGNQWTPSNLLGAGAPILALAAYNGRLYAGDSTGKVFVAVDAGQRLHGRRLEHHRLRRLQ